MLLEDLRQVPHPLDPLTLVAPEEPLSDEDLQLALYLCYELHYRGLPGVDDRWEWEGAEQREKYVTGELIAGVVYRCQVVVTNPTSREQKLDVLLQIPRGAVPVASGFFTRTMNLRLSPYATESIGRGRVRA